MATTFKPWQESDEYGIWYKFDTTTDGLSMHAHVHTSVRHWTRCISGSVAIYGDEIDVVLKAGEDAHYLSYRLHEIQALEVNSEIINIFDMGKPQSYEGLTDEELSGCINVVLLGREAIPK